MPVKILVAAQELATRHKGEIVAVYDGDYTPGNKEGLPNFIWLTISDAGRAAVDAYLGSWKKYYQYTIDNENPQRYTASIRVDPALVSAAGVNEEISVLLEGYLVNHLDYTITIQNRGNTFLTARIDKPADLIALRDDVNDKFTEALDFQRYYFAESDADAAIAAGGSMTRTAAQVQAIIVDRIAE